MPEQHGKYAGYTEYERKSEKIPLLAEKIDVGIAKELHLVLAPYLPETLQIE
jgi:hypothetical protein